MTLINRRGGCRSGITTPTSSGRSSMSRSLDSAAEAPQCHHAAEGQLVARLFCPIPALRAQSSNAGPARLRLGREIQRALPLDALAQGCPKHHLPAFQNILFRCPSRRTNEG